jgi:hypothetical protein
MRRIDDKFNSMAIHQHKNSFNFCSIEWGEDSVSTIYAACSHLVMETFAHTAADMKTNEAQVA